MNEPGLQTTDNRRPLTLIGKLQLAVFKFLIERELPFIANVEHPAILIEIKGRVLMVSQIEIQPSGRENILEHKIMPGTTRYMIEEDSRV